MIDDALIHRKELLRLLDVTAGTLRKWRIAGKLPPPDVPLSRRTQAWKRSTLEAAGIKLA